MLEIIRVGAEAERTEFLSLPARLYKRAMLTQNRDEEERLLTGRHTLSHCFELIGLICRRDGVVRARCAVTLYPDTDEAYFGFFESFDDLDGVRLMLREAEQIVLRAGRTRMTGPVDASFWIRYRLKTNRFGERPYVSEPCGLPYYENMLRQCGFEAHDEYVSNIYEKLPFLHYRKLEKYSTRYENFLKNGYIIVSPKRSEWENAINSVYSLIIKLYSDFPAFSYISREDFTELFSSYRVILDLSMVKLAYYNGEAVGFFIGMPDYGNRLYGKITPLTLLYVLAKRFRSRRYVMLYLGVDERHHGLGKAITQAIIDNVHRKNASAIGAFIHRGKITEAYVEEQKRGTYEYILFGKELIGLGDDSGAD